MELNKDKDKDKDNTEPNQKITQYQNFISYRLLDSVIKETNIPKKIIEETHSELFYETISGIGKVIFTNNIIFEGKLDKGILETEEGKTCTIIFQNGTKYIGEIHNNKLSGKGQFFFPSNAIYQGEVSNGLRNGYGVYTSPDGVTYEGTWLKGLKHGKGKMKRPLYTYEGEWNKGSICGLGRIKWDNGNIYNGMFNNNLINGDGYMVWSELNEKYIGEWKNNFQDGFGVHIWYEPKGEKKFFRNRYIGEWKKGVREGYGVFFYSNGAYYEGMWKNNYKEGFGILTFLDGSKYIGRFNQDRLIDKDENDNVNWDELNEHIDNEKNGKDNKKEKERNEPERKKTTLIIKGKNKRKEGNQIQNELEVIEESNYEIQRSKNLQHKLNGIKRKDENENEKEKAKGKDNIIHKEKVKKYKPILDLTDLIYLDENIKEIIPDIEKLIIRHLTDLRQIYWNIVKGEKDYEDLNSTKNIREATSINSLKQDIKIQSNEQTNFQTLNNLQIQKNQMTPLINLDTPNSTDFSFSMKMKDLWKFLRESGLINSDFQLCSFNRIYSNGEYNIIETFEIPEYLPEEAIYSFMKKQIYTSKENFLFKNKKYINYYYFKSNEQISDTIKDLYKQKSIIQTEINLLPSIHNKNIIILLRQFYEVLIRIAFLKYNTIANLSLTQKIKNLLSAIIIPKQKRNRSTNKTSLSRIEALNISHHTIQEKKNQLIEENLKEEFYFNYEHQIHELFNIIYNKTVTFPNYRDQTITYKYFYNKIIKRSKLLKDIIPNKFIYVNEIIKKLFSENRFFNEEETRINPVSSFVYIESLMNCEIIEYEFIEIVFLLVRRVNRENIKSDIEEESNYIINEIKEIAIKRKNEGRNKKEYFYPKNKKHAALEKIIEERKLKEMEIKKRKMECERYIRERKKMEEEKENAYKEINSEEEDEEYEDD